MKKLHDELKGKFALPSLNLIKYEKDHYRKQIHRVRDGHKQEISNIMKKAEVRTLKHSHLHVIHKFSQLLLLGNCKENAWNIS